MNPNFRRKFSTHANNIFVINCLLPPPQGYSMNPIVIDTLNLVSTFAEPTDTVRIVEKIVATLKALSVLGCPWIRLVAPSEWFNRLTTPNVSSEAEKSAKAFLIRLWQRGILILTPHWEVSMEIEERLIRDGYVKGTRPFDIAMRNFKKESMNRWKINDDLPCIEYALRHGALLLSNDKFKDIKKYFSGGNLKHAQSVISRNRIGINLAQEREATIGNTPLLLNSGSSSLEIKSSDDKNDDDRSFNQNIITLATGNIDRSDPTTWPFYRKMDDTESSSDAHLVKETLSARSATRISPGRAPH